MYRRLCNGNPARVCRLLALLLVGGLLAPGAHRAYHGLAWSEGWGAPAAPCDHARHGAGLEVVVPLFHDDLCPLCQRSLTSTMACLSVVAGVQARPPTPAAGALCLASASWDTLLIRGPPPRA